MTTADEVIGKFPCVRVLGHVPGGVACIVRGEEGLLVAERLERASATEEDVKVFLERARGISNMKHASLFRVRAVVDTPEVVAVVHDFTDGEWLDELKLASFPIASRLRIVVDVLSAVNALHSDPSTLPVVAAQAHVVHGEISDAHIVVGLDGATRLTRTVRAYPARTRPELANAWARWASPEQLLNDSAADGRVDIYAMGALLWEALAGHGLFANEDAPTVLARQVAGDLPRPRVPDNAPWCAPLADVAMKAMSLDPFNRYASAAELAGAIRLAAKNRLAAPADVATRVSELAGEKIRARRRALGEEARPVAARARAAERTTSPDAHARDRAQERSGIVARRLESAPPPTARGRAVEEIDLADIDVSIEAETSPALSAPIPFAPATEPDVLAHMPAPVPAAGRPVSRAPAAPSRPPPLPARASKAPPRVPGKSVAPPLPPRASAAPAPPVKTGPPRPALAGAVILKGPGPTTTSRSTKPSATSTAPAAPSRAAAPPATSTSRGASPPPAAASPVVPPPAEATEPMSVVTDDEDENDIVTMVSAPPVHTQSSPSITTTTTTTSTATPTETEVPAMTAVTPPAPQTREAAPKPAPRSATPAPAATTASRPPPAVSPFAPAPSAMPPPVRASARPNAPDVSPSMVPIPIQPPPPEILALADMPLPPAPARVEAEASGQSSALDDDAAARFAAIASAAPGDMAPTTPNVSDDEAGDLAAFGMLDPHAVLRRRRIVFGVIGAASALAFVTLLHLAFGGHAGEEASATTLTSTTHAKTSTTIPADPAPAAKPTAEPVASASAVVTPPPPEPPPTPPPPAPEPAVTIVQATPDPTPPVTHVAPTPAPVVHTAPAPVAPAPHPVATAKPAPAPAPTVKKKPPHSKYEPSGI